MSNFRLVVCMAIVLVCCLALPGLVCAAQGITFVAGAGGHGGIDTPGGTGGNAIATVNGDVAEPDVTLSGGNGGNSGVGPQARGGDGGNNTLTIHGTLTTTGVMEITAGNGGDSNGSVPGGNGGTHTFSAGSAVLGGALTLTSGTDGAGNSPAFAGRGGAVVFTTNTLAAPELNLNRNSGALILNVGTLDVSSGDTILNLNATTAAGVSIGRVALAGGRSFTVNSANSGTGTFGLLDVSGAGGILGGNFAPMFTDVNLAGGSALTSVNPLNFSTLRVLGPSASYDGVLSATGRTVLFALDGVPSGSTMLAVSNPGAMDINGASLHFFPVPRGRPFPPAGYALTLIDGKTGLPPRDTIEARQGVTLRHVFDLSAAGSTLIAAYRATDAHPQAKALSEGRAAGHAFLNQGSDLIIGPGIHSILAQGKTGGGFVPFAVGMGGSSRYNTGSHVDVEGVSIMTGLAWRQALNDKGDNLMVGAFFEAGWGGYDSYNSFSYYASVKGDGDTSYYGGGVLARYGAACGGYVDASFRAGQVDTDFSSNDLRDPISGQKADYDASSAYYGAHAGIGYVWQVTEKASLDLSTRYIWTHQNSDTVNVAGDPVKFEAANSQRWRTGARFAYAVNERVTPYAGAYYDYEFDGRARAVTYGFNIDAPSLKGGTGVGELGLSVTPVAGSGFSMDLGVQGYIGARRGVGGSLQLKFEF